MVSGVGTGNNLIINGSFEQGNSGFSSSYGVNQPSSGFYYVDADPSVFNSGHSGVDNTSGFGNFLIVDGATTANTNVWCQTVVVVPNTDYSFSAWVNNLIITANNFTDPTLQFTINGVPLCASLTLPEIPDIWVEMACTWNSGINTSVTICLYSLSATGVGNDFGVDDISFIGPSTCASMDSVTVFVSPAMIVATTATDETCVGACDGSVLVSISGGVMPYSYLWDNGAGTDSSGSALCNATYTVLVTDSVGCFSTGAVVVNPAIPLALLTASIDASCGNADGTALVNASGGVGPYKYLWDDINAQTNISATGLPAGGYTVLVTDSNGCTDNATIAVNDAGAPAATISASNNVFCNGDSVGSATVTALGGTIPYTFLWDDPMAQTTSTATGLPAGTYIATVADAIGCVSNAIVIIAEPPALGFTANTQSSACGLSNGLAYVIVTGGVPPYIYLWNDPLQQTTDTAFSLVAGPYTIVITDAFNCVDSVNVIVSDLSGLTIQSFTNVGVSCNGLFDGEATVLVTGGSTPYTYQWDAGTGSQTGSKAINLGPSNYSVTLLL